jgi:hypothetical protein
MVGIAFIPRHPEYLTLVCWINKSLRDKLEFCVSRYFQKLVRHPKDVE